MTMPYVFSDFDPKEGLWERLAVCKQDIFLYGMGNGADKILAVLEEKNIPVKGVFASDGFVRGQTFHGMKVGSYSDLSAAYPPHTCTVLLAFGSARGEVLELFDRVAARYELLVPDVPVCGDTLFDTAFLTEHKAEFAAARALFEDEESRRIFDLILKAKHTGRYDCLRRAVSPPDDISRLLSLSAVRRMADFGAYNGDTLREMLELAPLQYAFCAEPDPRNFRKLQAFCNGLKTLSVDCRPVAVSDRAGYALFDASGNRNAGLADGKGGKTVETCTPDLLLRDTDIDYIKYDVEGAEKEALIGSKELIARCRPRLKIACYHRSEDLFALPLLTKSIAPDHLWYLRRQDGVPAWDIDLLGVSGKDQV